MLEAPKHSLTRPTSSRAREALFNILGERVDGASVVDCFAGSGALGLEALSRGAVALTCFESNREALATIRRNIDLLGVGSKAQVIGGRLPNSLPSSLRFDLLFLDPPWDKDLCITVINAVSAAGLANEGALAVLEERRGNVRPGLYQQAGWRVNDQRTYGDTELSFLSYEPG